MRVRVEPTGRRIAPFDDPVAEIPIANRPLSVWQEEMLDGFERVEQPPCLSIPDTLFTTPELLRRFVDQANGRNAVAVLAAGHFAENTTAVQPGVTKTGSGWRFEQVRFLSGGDEEPVEIVLDVDETTHEIAMPEVFGGSTTIALPRHPLITLHHWVHILWANQAAGALEARRTPWWKTALKVIWAIVRSLSLNKWRVLGKLNTVGRNCDIHPTAVVEGCTLGDNVSIGPYARVLFSRLDDDVKIMTGAEVEACTLGKGAAVAQRSGIRLCVLYPGAFASQQQMQACVLGRGVLTTPGSYSLDLNLDREIRVVLDGELHSTRSRFLGSAFGHGSRIAAGVWIASGREIPNGTFAIGDPQRIAQRVEGEPGDAPFVVRDGKLVPLERK